MTSRPSGLRHHAGERRDDGRAFLIALVAGLLGGVSEAIDAYDDVTGAKAGVRSRTVIPDGADDDPACLVDAELHSW